MDSAVLLGTQRSGTTLLRQALGTNSGIDPLFGEIFDPAHVDRPESFFGFLLARVRESAEWALPGMRPRIFRAYLEFLDELAPASIKLLDVKYNSRHHLMTWWDDGVDHLREFCDQEALPIVHLIRRDHVSTVLSTYMAVHTNVYTVAKGESLPTPPCLAVDPQQLIADVRGLETYVEHMRLTYASLPRYREVFYDDLLDPNDPSVLNRSCLEETGSFLGIAGEFDIEPPTRRLRADSFRESLENFDEVSAALRAEGYDIR